MARIQFSSGVHTGEVGNGVINRSWFGQNPVTQFDMFGLSSGANVQARLGPQGLAGHALVRDQPVVFTFERRARDILSDHIAVIAAQDLMNGQSRRNLAGSFDAVMRSGFLAFVEWDERRNSGGVATFSDWRVVQVTTAAVRGLEERLELTCWPCSIVAYFGGQLAVTPQVYASLEAG